MLKPTVSIVITCYNKADFIKESIESAINQTYKNIEIVCVNDCSTDDSQKVLCQLKDKYNFTCIDNKENIGVIKSRNIAIDKAKGEYILPLDGDDTIEPTFVEKCITVIQNNPKVSWVYANTKYIDKNSLPIKELILPKFEKNIFIYHNCVVCTAIFKKSDFLEVGGFKSYMKHGCEDHELWISFVEKGLVPVRVEDVLFNYRLLQNNSRNIEANDKSDLWRKELIKHHLELYLDNPFFVKKVFSNYDQQKIELQNDIQRLKKHYAKYKHLFFAFLSLFFISLVCNLFIFFVV